MDFKEYQKRVMETAVYPKAYGLGYTALGLSGEAGEVADKVKKVYRDREGIVSHEAAIEIRKEIGDVLWYAAALCHEIGVCLNDAAELNLQKLADRKARGVLQGSGDNR